MAPESFDKKRVHKIYYQLARIYHPDAPATSELSAEERSERFKRISEAYATLKDDSARQRWNMRNLHPYSPTYTGRAHTAQGGPSDTARDSPEWRYGSQQYRQHFDESLRRNRMWLLKVISGIVIFVGILEISTVFRMSSRRSAELDALSKEAGRLHALASRNYDQGLTYDERIQRFVEHRERTLRQSRKFKYVEFLGDGAEPNE